MSPTSARTRPTVRDDLVALEGYHSPQVDVDVRLNTNESPYPPPPAFQDALAAELSRVQWHRYPDRAATELREAIAEQHDVDPKQVFAANGSNEVLQSVCLAYGGFGRTAALFSPTYLMHGQIARTVGTTVVKGRRNDDFTLDMSEVSRIVDEHDPSILFVTSPNNPTGIVESPEAITAAVDAAPGVVVVDEAYGQFADFVKHVHVVPLDGGGFDRLAEHVAALADAEGLHAHAESVRLRQRSAQS